MGRHTDYVYRNMDDTVRVRVHRRENGRWDYDVFYPDKMETFSEGAGDDFASKRAALAEANHQHGPLRSVATKGSVVDDAWRRRAARTTHHARKKPAAQLEREIAEALNAPRELQSRGVDEEPTHATHSTIKTKGPAADTTESLVDFLAEHGITRGGRGAALGAIRLFDKTAFVKERTGADGAVEITISHPSSRGTSRQRFRSRAGALADLRRQAELNQRLAQSP